MLSSLCNGICNIIIILVIKDIFATHKYALTKMCVMGYNARVRVKKEKYRSLFDILTDVRQADVLLPLLFNIALRYVVRRLSAIGGSVDLGKLFQIFTYAEDTDLLCDTEEGLKRLYETI